MIWIILGIIILFAVGSENTTPEPVADSVSPTKGPDEDTQDEHRS